MKLLPKTIAGKVFLTISFFITISFMIYLGGPIYSYLSYSPHEGDIVFQSLHKNPLVIAIEGITRSKYSHCGIIIKKNSKWMVLEAVGPVKETPLLSWILQSRDFKIDAYRLKPKFQKNIPNMIKEANKFKGLPYDIHYKMDNEKIYCSELIYKAYKNATGENLGELVKLKNLNWVPYKFTIEYFEGGAVPEDRQMIPPVSIANSEKLLKL